MKEYEVTITLRAMLNARNEDQANERAEEMVSAAADGLVSGMAKKRWADTDNLDTDAEVKVDD